MGEVEHIPDARAAIVTIIKELDWAYEGQMHLIDLIGDLPGHDRVINYPNLRKAASQALQKSCRTRDAAIAALERELA
jgi:hypothetical protein